jgi:hypothetical protein
MLVHNAPTTLYDDVPNAEQIVFFADAAALFAQIFCDHHVVVLHLYVTATKTVKMAAARTPAGNAGIGGLPAAPPWHADVPMVAPSTQLTYGVVRPAAPPNTYHFTCTSKSVKRTCDTDVATAGRPVMRQHVRAPTNPNDIIEVTTVFGLAAADIMWTDNCGVRAIDKRVVAWQPPAAAATPAAHQCDTGLGYDSMFICDHLVVLSPPIYHAVKMCVSVPAGGEVPLWLNDVLGTLSADKLRELTVIIRKVQRWTYAALRGDVIVEWARVVRRI